MVWAVSLSPSFSHSFDHQCLLNYLWPAAESCLLLSSSDSLEQVQGELLLMETKHNFPKKKKRKSFFSSETKQGSKRFYHNKELKLKKSWMLLYLKTTFSPFKLQLHFFCYFFLFLVTRIFCWSVFILQGASIMESPIIPPVAYLSSQSALFPLLFIQG